MKEINKTFKTVFNPDDFIQGKAYRAVLSESYFSLLKEIKEKVSADDFMFAQAVSAYLYRAVAPESEILSAMVAASRIGESKAVDSLANDYAKGALNLLNGVEDQSQLLAPVKDIACAIAVVYFQMLFDYQRRTGNDLFHWNYREINAYLCNREKQYRKEEES